MRIAFFSTKPYDSQSFDSINHTHTIDYFDVALNQQTAGLWKGADAVCVFVNDTLDEACLSQLTAYGIKLIALRCTGFNNVDITAAKKLQLTLVRVPAYSPHAVAEHAFGLLLNLNRKIHKAYNRVREGNFSLNGLLGFDLYDKTLGLVGLGEIGRCMARIASGFGCNVIAVDPCADTSDIPLVTLDELWASSDIISLHCPLNADTHHLVNAQSIAKMTPGVVLLNTGRGGLIDTAALIQGLKKGHFHSVGLDVYEQEEGLFFSDHSADIIQDDALMRLMSFPNVLITSHQGFFTQEALQQIASTTLNSCTEFEQGRAPTNEIT